MTDRNFNNANLTETIYVNEPLTELVLGSVYHEFVLSEADFLRLSSEENKFKSWANGIFLIAIGYALNLAPGFFVSSGENIKLPSSGEFTVFCLTFGSAIILSIIGLFIPNEKKKVLKKIGRHFESSHRSTGVIRKPQ